MNYSTMLYTLRFLFILFYFLFIILFIIYFIYFLRSIVVGPNWNWSSINKFINWKKAWMKLDTI